MKLIGITQRVATIPGRDERRDCLDQNWARLLDALGLVVVPLANAGGDVAAYVSELGLAGVILSGGNDIDGIEGARDTAPERDLFERQLIGICRARGLPLLGVCRGMQMLNLSAGGRLERGEGHVAIRHMVSMEAPTTEGGGHGFADSEFEVNSFHEYVISRDGLAPGMTALAVGADGTIEAMRDETGAAWGQMWHPERETPFVARDLALLRRIFEPAT